MTQVAVKATPIGVDTRRIEDGPTITIKSGQTTVSPTVTPACVDAENTSIKVGVSAAPTVVQTSIYRADIGVSVDGPIAVETSTVVIQGPRGTGGGGSSFLPPPDFLDESDPTFFYYGWADVSGTWLIRRATRASAHKQDAATGYPDLASTWPNRTSLNYA